MAKKKKKDYSINGKPNSKVSSQCAPAREKKTWGWKVSWKVPSAATSSTNRKRATGVDCQWIMNWGYKDTRNPRITKSGGTSFTSNTCWLNGGWTWQGKSKKIKITRNSFYPVTKQKLFGLYCDVYLKNNKGRGSKVRTYKGFSKPDKPSISAPSQNKDNGVVSCTVTTPAGTENDKERWDTEYLIYVLDTRTMKKEQLVKKGTSRSTSFNLSRDINDRFQLTYGQYVRVRFKARARGWAGDSAWVERTIHVSYPAQATIQGVDIPNKNSTSKVTARIKTNSSTTHPVTGCRLQTLTNVDYKNAGSIPATANWQDLDIVDNGSCTALACSVRDVLPEDPGKTSWVRVKTWSQIEDQFYRYSNPVRLNKLETPVPAADAVTVVSVEPGTDGESAVVTLGWNKDGKDDSTSTEISWSDDENAWRSTKSPSTYEFDWSDKKLVVDGTTYNDSAVVHIRDLEEGTKYFVKARRHLQTDSVDDWGKYAGPVSVIPTTTPTSVELTIPSFVARGNSLALLWTYDSTSTQRGWELITGEVETKTETVVDPTTQQETTRAYTTIKNKTEVVVARGSDALGSCVLDAARLAELIGTADSLPLAVRVTTGGDYVQSEAKNVRVADAPTLLLAVPTTITEQGTTISMSCSTPANIALVVTAQGAQGEFPDGTRAQIAGDTVFSDVYSPQWTAGDGVYNASLVLPSGLDFWDNAKYTFRATATDVETQLVSAAAEVETQIVWAHQAPAPSEDIDVTCVDSTDEEGFRTRIANITLAAPENAAEGDVYDVYRVTPDGSYLIAQGLAQTATLTDNYAPYSALEDSVKAYRFCVRTSDGDENWDDWEYDFVGKDLRIDFGDDYVELPWNLTVGDAFAKDFEARSHLGSATPEGYWNESVARKASFSTDLIEIQEQEKAAKLRALARYAGPVFVRVPDGCAYQANVEVSGLDEGYNSASIAVALDGEEVSLTEAFMATIPLPVEPADDTPTEDESVPDVTPEVNPDDSGANPDIAPDPDSEQAEEQEGE